MDKEIVVILVTRAERAERSCIAARAARSWAEAKAWEIARAELAAAALTARTATRAAEWAAKAATEEKRATAAEGWAEAATARASLRQR